SFFFQAEDGIRDPLVTGVQTCALPICSEKRTGSTSRVASLPSSDFSTSTSCCFSGIPVGITILPPGLSCASRGGGIKSGAAVTKIGRASCRERVWVWEGGGSVCREG